jgi:polysaccharide pyruvyl transferase WcaK-like protein
MRRRPIVLTHAYDARNRGDLLLVDETIFALERAGVRQEDCFMIACDASTFSPANPALQYPMFGESGYKRSPGIPALSLLTIGALGRGRLGRFTDVGHLINSAGLVVGVGGGYLRAPGGKESLGTQVIHVPQLVMAGYADCPSIYMPQSIGPLTGAIGAGIRRSLSRIDVVLARDQRTIDEVGGNDLRRFPDLAVLKIGRDLDGIRRSSGGRTAGMARDLNSEGYRERIQELDGLLPVSWLAHSSVDKNDDGNFYQSCGFAYEGTSDKALAQGDIGVVISVRLHGALQALLAGIPAIHLSYERKGPGAYSDLGLLEWVHSARSFSPAAVAEQARKLAQDSSEYWYRIERSRERLLDLDQQLIDTLKTLMV